jgi:hypothetical protein
MVKARAAGGRRRAAEALPSIEPKVMMISACRYEGRAGPACGKRKTQHATIEIQSALQVSHLQMDMADPYPWVDRGHLYGGIFDGLGLRHGFILALGAFEHHM